RARAMVGPAARELPAARVDAGRDPTAAAAAEARMIRVPGLTPPEGAYESEVEARVIFADTDALGMAYYATALRWFELGRSELLRAADVRYGDFAAEGFVLPVVETWVRYRAPVRYDDLLRIRSWVHELGTAT